MVTRPRLDKPFVLVNEYGYTVESFVELSVATAALERYPFRGTTFGRWWLQQREGRT